MPVEFTPDQRAAGETEYNEDNLGAPEGWRWAAFPRWYAPRDCDPGSLRVTAQRRSLTGVQSDMTALLEWAIEHDVFIEVQHVRPMLVNNVYISVPDRIRVNPVLDLARSAYFADYTCPYNGCEASVNAVMASCPVCARALTCDPCHLAFCSDGTLIAVGEGDEQTLGCINCTRRCRHCVVGIPRTWRTCSEHGEHYHCTSCEQEFDGETSTRTMVGDAPYCTRCGESFCSICTSGPFDTLLSVDGRRTCRDCWAKAHALRVENTDFLDNTALTADQWLMEAMPDRPTRVVSIEQEFEAPGEDASESPGSRVLRRARTGDGHPGNTVARALYTQGLSAYGEMAGWHSSGHTFPCHVESDSSVSSGGELIFNRMNLATEEDAGNMVRILNTVQEQLAEGVMEFTVRCGTHIHIDLHGYTIPDARNYVTIYSYIEDVIYRLGSAGYGDHRAVISDNDYALPIRKDKWGDIRKFGVEFLRRADHTDSLNMQHFYASMKSCKCGAIEFGNMADCTCTRKKCTAEWRVFNGTGNPRKLHAYIALVQAVTAWCQDRELNVDDFEPLEFQQNVDFTKEHTLEHAQLIEAWKERMEWMFLNLPLTANERESILYCMMQGPMKVLGHLFATRLRELPFNGESGRTLVAPTVADRNAPPPVEEPRRDPHGNCYGCGEPHPFCECGGAEPYDDDGSW